MTRPVRTGTPVARPAVHYYPMPEVAVPDVANLAVYRQHAAELAARRETDRILYLRWKQRQAAMAEKDRRNRTFLLGLGATVGVGLFTGLGVAAWLLWHALTSIDWLLVLPLALVALGLLGRVGHRCITVVQHWH
jgi:hypothetical protein